MLRKGLSCWHPCAHLLARLNERYRMTSSVLHSLLCSDQVAVPSDAQLHSSMASALPSFSASFSSSAAGASASSSFSASSSSFSAASSFDSEFVLSFRLIHVAHIV